MATTDTICGGPPTWAVTRTVPPPEPSTALIPIPTSTGPTGAAVRSIVTTSRARPPTSIRPPSGLTDSHDGTGPTAYSTPDVPTDTTSNEPDVSTLPRFT